jgi:membrane fusion protein (multidrug efflux system)
MAIVEDNPWVVANFKETQLERLRPQQAVALEIDTFPSHVFRGQVDSIAPGSGNQFALLPPDNATGNFTKIVQRIPVKIVFDPDSIKGYEDLLAPGMSTVVTVTTR